MRAATSAIAAAVLMVTVPAVWADVYVVVNAANAIKSMTTKEAVDLYMGRTREFNNGNSAMLFDLPKDNPARGQFYQHITGMSPAQVNSYWSRLMFTGQTMPPQPLPTEMAVAEMIKRNPNAVGYLTNEPTDRALRVVLTVKTGP